MRYLSTLSNDYIRRIIRDLKEQGLSSDDILWIMFEGDSIFCANLDELAEAIDEIWGYDFFPTNDLLSDDLEDYILSNDCIFPLFNGWEKFILCQNERKISR